MRYFCGYSITIQAGYLQSGFTSRLLSTKGIIISPDVDRTVSPNYLQEIKGQLT